MIMRYSNRRSLAEKLIMANSTDFGLPIASAAIRFFFASHIDFSAGVLLPLYQLFSYRKKKNFDYLQQVGSLLLPFVILAGCLQYVGSLLLQFITLVDRIYQLALVYEIFVASVCLFSWSPLKLYRLSELPLVRGIFVISVVCPCYVSSLLLLISQFYQLEPNCITILMIAFATSFLMRNHGPLRSTRY